MELYRSIQYVYENYFDFHFFTAKWWITMSVTLNCTSVGNVRVVPQCSCTALYRRCTKIQLMAECSTASGELP